MKKVPFDKPALSYDEQLDKLIKRGMTVANREQAIQALSHINYYRLGVYWYGFESEHEQHSFREATSFEDVVSLYVFDRKLRLLVLDAIERIEISFRTQWTYHMSQAYGSHAHMNEAAHNQSWQHTVKEMHRELKRSDERFIKQIMSKYSDDSPPIWAVSEVISFGLLSKWYKNLRVNTVRKNISRIYGVHPDVFQSWMQHLTVLRNNCALHSRLWNRTFEKVAPIFPKRNLALPSEWLTNQHQLSNSLTIIIYLLDIISLQHGWRERFVELVAQHPKIPLVDMGLEDGWTHEGVWKN